MCDIKQKSDEVIPIKPLNISPETAVKLAEALKVPVEHLMHMPQHILMQKLLEISKDTGEKS